MTHLLLSLLACPPSSSDSLEVAGDPEPFCVWEEGACSDNNPPMPLDGEIMLLLLCQDYVGHYTNCNPQSWRLYEDGTWAPQICSEDWYYRVCIAH